MFKEIQNDLPASIVVFFVAVPLCLGIALASGAPLFSGIIAGVIGGMVVGALSGSALGVSGPGNGLTILVFSAVSTLGSWQAFLTALVLAGAMQFVLGCVKAGFIAYFFPSSVIKGMLAGIGLLIVLKQIPHALGYDKDNEADLAFLQTDGETTLSALSSAFTFITPGAALIAVVSLVVLLLWEMVLMKKHRFFQIIQGSMVAVALGILLNLAYQQGMINLTLEAEHLVSLPVIASVADFSAQFSLPDFSVIQQMATWKIALLITIVASMETLLSLEAADRLDPQKRTTSPNRELIAQGLGNMLSGLCGGLPITQVIVRSSVNISFGAKTKLATILHGLLILVSALTLVKLMNLIPLASLAAILIVVGYKLARPSLFVEQFRLGSEQFIPFVATVIGMLFTDLLVGVGIGMAFGIYFTLRQSYFNSHSLKDTVDHADGHEVHHIVLAEDLSFFTKPSLLNTLNNIPRNAKVIIDDSKSKTIAYDVLQMLKDYQVNAASKGITVETINLANV